MHLGPARARLGHLHALVKLAALEKHIAFPVAARLYLGDPRLLLGLALLAVTAICDLVLMRRRPPL